MKTDTRKIHDNTWRTIEDDNVKSQLFYVVTDHQKIGEIEDSMYINLCICLLCMMKTQNYRRVCCNLVQNDNIQRVEYSKMFILKTPTLGHHC